VATAIELRSINKDFVMNSKTSLLKSLFNKNHSLKRINAVSNLNFKINQGEVFGVIGRNGAGKSTLLQIISKTLTPTSGEVYVSGKIGALLELGSSFHPDFTGVENIYLTASVMGLKKKEIEKCLTQIIDFADIHDFINLPLRTYSTGMSMRLAFAIATSTKPDILVIDEALSVGDQEFSQKSFNRIMELKDMGTTILFCSHSTYQVEALCNRTLWLEKGKIVKIGMTKDVVAAYKEDLEFSSYKRKREQIHEHKSSQGGNTNIEKIHFFRNAERITEHTVVLSRKDGLKIKTWFRSQDIKPSLAITIRKKSGEIVGSAGSHNDKKEFLEINNEKFFEIDFPEIPLLKGNYYIDISLFCEHGINTLDFINRVLTLKVIQDDLEQGVAHLNHKWRTEP
jgi:lipopolysaccharide transport system ATP-binding protein